jgi:hypothetical protein
MPDLGIVALLLVALGAPGAPPGAAGVNGAMSAPAWHVDTAAVVLREAWDYNGSSETLAGVTLGADRRVWHGVAVRGEIVALRVEQVDGDAWLGGFTVGMRLRWGGAGRRPFTDVAVGSSNATRPVPSGGTRVNYLAVIGAGIERPAGPMTLSMSARWTHVSNNGREGRRRNPDIQSLGVAVGFGWRR